MTVPQGVRKGDFLVSASLLGLALLLGGGSANSPVQRMIVELASVLALGWFLVRGWRAPLGRAAWSALALIGLVVLLMVLQTIPLPPGIWRGLPGHAVATEVLDVIGAGQTWRPLSLDPEATREAGYFLVVPIAMFVATLHLDREQQVYLLFLVVAAALASALLVMLQAQDMMWLTLYDAPHATKGKGIFANKNHNAAFLVLAIPVAAMLVGKVRWFRSANMRRGATITLIAVLALAVLGCLSRAGVALLPVALLSCVPLLGGIAMLRRRWIPLAVGGAGLVVAAVLVAQSAIVRETLDRFEGGQEGRYVFWPDVIASIRQFLPLGSGVGTFVPVFRMNESLNAVHLTYTNHAHSDFLEIALEAGVPGLVLTAAFLVWFGITAFSRLRAHRMDAGFAPLWTATVGIALLLAASIVDYPLRTLLLACIFAVFAAVLASSSPFGEAMRARAPAEPESGAGPGRGLARPSQSEEP